ncbi:MAG: FAD-dependent oxidoreductase, partial [Clostridia bacterium]|nr:FAD-dependent oxidoreductase [Clostridia bacterium]
MLRISNIKMPVEHTEDDLKEQIKKILKTDEIEEISIFKRSIDSRRKNDISLIYTVDVKANLNEEKILKKSDPKKVSEAKIYSYQMPENKRTSKLRPVVVGFGPAGMYCALLLARAGLKPLILERGADVDQ